LLDSNSSSMSVAQAVWATHAKYATAIFATACSYGFLYTVVNNSSPIDDARARWSGVYSRSPAAPGLGRLLAPRSAPSPAGSTSWFGFGWICSRPATCRSITVWQDFWRCHLQRAQGQSSAVPWWRLASCLTTILTTHCRKFCRRAGAGQLPDAPGVRRQQQHVMASKPQFSRRGRRRKLRWTRHIRQ